jgi:hypothetical protein
MFQGMVADEDPAFHAAQCGVVGVVTGVEGALAMMR